MEMGWLFLGERRVLDYCLHCVKLLRVHFHLIKMVAGATWRLVTLLVARLPVGPDLKYAIETIIKRKYGPTHLAFHTRNYATILFGLFFTIEEFLGMLTRALKSICTRSMMLC